MTKFMTKLTKVVMTREVIEREIELPAYFHEFEVWEPTGYLESFVRIREDRQIDYVEFTEAENGTDKVKIHRHPGGSHVELGGVYDETAISTEAKWNEGVARARALIAKVLPE